MDVFNIIKQFVSFHKDKDSGTLGLDKLLPIERVATGFDDFEFKFDPPKYYKKKKGYEIDVPLGDDDKYVEAVTQLNIDIRAYNKWAEDQNKPLMGEYSLWQSVLISAYPTYRDRNFEIENWSIIVDNRQLYSIAKDLPEDKFVKRFNKTIFDYILQERQEAEELGIWDSDYKWWQPVREFENWFTNRGLDHTKIKSFGKQVKIKGKRGRKPDPNKEIREGHIRKRYAIYKSKDAGDGTKADASRIIYEILQKNKPEDWEGPIYAESTIRRVLKKIN